jgi:hypothetical protein
MSESYEERQKRINRERQERFRAAFDFMRLRADIGEVDEVLADWWQEFSTGDDAVREDLVDQVRKENLKRPRAVRAPRPASAPPAVRAVAVQLVYELYPGIPLLTKYVTIASAGPAAAGLVIDAVTTETLRLARQYSPWELGGESPAGAGSWAGA